MKTRLALVSFLVFFLFGTHAFARLIFVDNRASAGGDGTAEHPFQSIVAASAASQESDAIYVAPSPQPYQEAVTLKAGQRLVGSPDDVIVRSTGLDIIASGTDTATIRGTVNVTSDNTIAALAIVSDSVSAVSGSSSSGQLVIRNVRLHTSNGAVGLLLTDHSGRVTVTGGGLQSEGNGGGVAILGGGGDVTFDRFPISGSFSTAIRIGGRAFGFIIFRDGSDVRVDAATQDAIETDNLGLRCKVIFGSALAIRTTGARGIVATGVQNLSVTGDATIETTNAAAIDISGSGGDLTFRQVSAAGGALNRAIRVVRFHGRLRIEGGAIRSAVRAVELEDAGSVEIAGLVVERGGGVLVNKVRDVTFSGVQFDHSAGIVVNDVDGTVRFERCSSTTPMTIEQRAATGRVVLDRCQLESHSVKIHAAEKSSLAVELDATDVSGGGIDVSANGSAHLGLVVHGGRFTGSSLAESAAETATACADFSGIRFTPPEPAIHLGVSGDAKMNVAGPAAGGEEPAIRAALSKANNDAAVTIDVPAASLSAGGTCP